jgi:metal-responsive CopG/Arc/MetJ family transcriptional regulator
MKVVRINVSIPKDVFMEISEDVEPRKRSRFITEAVKDFLKKKRAKRLAAEYEEASSEIKRINRELEGAIADGLD